MGFALVQCRIETGRTHQIRVHMQSIGHPLVSDYLYARDRLPALFQASKKFIPRVFLHHFRIALPVPVPHADPEELNAHTSSLPDDLVYGLNNLTEDRAKNERLEQNLDQRTEVYHQVFGSPDLRHALSGVVSLSSFRGDCSEPSASSKRARRTY